MMLLVMGSREREALNRIKEFAQRKENYVDVIAAEKGERTPPGDIQDHCTTIPVDNPGFGFRVVYSVDTNEVLGPVHHMSVSCLNSPNPPAPIVVRLLARILELPEADVMVLGEPPEAHVAHYVACATPEGKAFIEAARKEVEEELAGKS
jgi:hypothetical protein